MFYVVFLETDRRGDYELTTDNGDDMYIYSTKPFFIGIKRFTQIPKNVNIKLIAKLGNLQGYINIVSDLSKHDIYTFNVLTDDGKTTNMLSKFDIQLVTPYDGDIQGRMEIAFPDKFCIGHRGFGQNTVSKDVLENSLTAFEKGFKSGCNYVEFDIQFSKDGVPVIFHDWILKSDHEYRGAEYIRKTNEGIEYAVNQLTLKQFMKSGLRTEYKTPRCSFKDILVGLPIDIPFDIEIKSIFEEPQFFSEVPYPDRNVLIDSILKDLEKYGNGRKLFFSSFDPMTIIMLHLKQMKWPVLQLSCKEEWEEERIALSRLKSLVGAYKSLGIVGFVLDSDLVFRHKEIAQEIRDKYLLCTYGKFNNTESGVREQLQFGVRGICTDVVPQITQVVHSFH